MARYLFTLLLCLCFTGCTTRSDSNVNPLCYQKTKPNVAFIPLKESLQYPYQWDVSKELTDNILQALVNKNTVYITPYIHFKTALDFTAGCDYFSSDLNFANYFGVSDFLVVSELLTHEIIPYAGRSETEPKRNLAQFKTLKLGTRVRVLDLRYEHPKVILQKFVESHEIVSGTECRINYNEIGPEHELYQTTPLYRGHCKIANELANEIESAILCNW